MKKVEQFTNYDVADKINKFLEEHDVEYVDMKLTDDFVYLIYSDRKNGNYRKPYEKYPEKMADGE